MPFYSYSSSIRDNISQDAWEEVFPHLLPDSLEIKHDLDALFSKSRIILNAKTLKKAGFTNYTPREYTRVIVSKHPNFPGYVFKIYLDAQRHKSDMPEPVIFLKRIKGALAIAKFIEDHELQDYFKVPKKWIYLLPNHPAPPKEFPGKNFILVVEDMDVLDNEENKKAWASHLVTYELLENLHKILKEIGLRDCAKIDNIPFSKDGKVAFIDTQSHGFKSVPFKRLKKALSPECQAFWDEL